MFPRFMLSALIVAPILTLNACTTVVASNPPRTATEQLVISAAAERAADKITLDIPGKSKAFVDATNFEGTDSKNALGAIRASLLEKGVYLVGDKKDAQIVVEVRAGALSTDQDTFLVGIPQFTFPVPFASSPLSFPEIAIYSSTDQKGVAKFAAASYDAKQGNLISSQTPQYGYAHNTKKTVLIFFSWTDNDALPKEENKAEETKTSNGSTP